MIRAETTTVYRANGRRYLTLRAAANAAVRGRLASVCDCDYCDHPEMPGCPTEHLACPYHNGSERALKIARRLARIYVAAYRAQKAGAA